MTRTELRQAVEVLAREALEEQHRAEDHLRDLLARDQRGGADWQRWIRVTYQEAARRATLEHVLDLVDRLDG